MQQLHLVGFTTDHKGLILGTRRGSEEGSFVVTLDRAFVEQVEELLQLQASEAASESGSSAAGNGLAPLRRPKVESRLTPRQVQAMLRTGRSVSEVAEEAGMSEDWVGRFAPPVLAEQARVIERATGLAYSKPRIGPSTQPLGESVIWNLAERGIILSGRAVEDAWNAFQQPDGTWVVRVSYLAERRRQHADWSVDMSQGAVKALNRLANELGYVEPGRRRPAALPPPTPVSASAQRAASAPPRPTPPAPLPPRPSGRLSLLTTTNQPARTIPSSAPPRPAPPPTRSADPPPSRTERGSSDRPKRRPPGDADDEAPADRPKVRAREDSEEPASERPRVRLPRDSESAAGERPPVRLRREPESSGADRPKVRARRDADEPASERPRVRLPRDSESAAGERPRVRLRRESESAAAERPRVRLPRESDADRPRRLRARDEERGGGQDRTTPPEPGEPGPRPSQQQNESPTRGETAGPEPKPRRERPLRAPSRQLPAEPSSPVPSSPRRPLTAPRVARPARPQDPPASAGPPPSPSPPSSSASPSSPEARRPGPAVAEMEPPKRTFRLPEVVPNNHGVPPIDPVIAPRRPLRARRILIDDVGDDDAGFAQPAQPVPGERTAHHRGSEYLDAPMEYADEQADDDPVTAPVPVLDMLDYDFGTAIDDVDQHEGAPGTAEGDSGRPHDQVLIRTGQAGAARNPNARNGAQANGKPDDRRGRRRLRRRGQDPS